jgi:hypothetical protein
VLTAPTSARSKPSPFAALVIVAHRAGKANAMTAFWTRAISGYGSPCHRLPDRHSQGAAIIFTLGYVAVAGIFREVIR